MGLKDYMRFEWSEKHTAETTGGLCDTQVLIPEHMLWPASICTEGDSVCVTEGSQKPAPSLAV